MLSSALGAVRYRNSQTHKEISLLLLLLSLGRLSVIIYYYTFLLLFSLLFSISLRKFHVLENWYVRHGILIAAVHVCIRVLNPNVLRSNDSRQAKRSS